MERELYGVFSDTSYIIGAYRTNYQRQIKRKHRIKLETVFSNPIIKILD